MRSGNNLNKCILYFSMTHNKQSITCVGVSKDIFYFSFSLFLSFSFLDSLYIYFGVSIGGSIFFLFFTFPFFFLFWIHDIHASPAPFMGPFGFCPSGNYEVDNPLGFFFFFFK